MLEYQTKDCEGEPLNNALYLQAINLVAPLFHPFRVILILSPSRRIIQDILADAVQIVLVADNVFVIISLPDGRALGLSHIVNAFGAGRFEGTNDGWDGIDGRFSKTFARRGTARRAPTIDNNNAMQMVRHDHECIHRNTIAQ